MAAKRPHVLLITTDEQHRESLSCLGATAHRTPHLDRLASEGMRFDYAYATSPVCLPSRVSIATGLYPHNSRSISNVVGASLNLRRPNIFREFKRHGYHTSMHGKCHFVPVPYAGTTADFTLEYEHIRLYYVNLGIDHLDLQDDKQVSVWFYDDYAKALERAGLLKAYRDLVHNVGRTQRQRFLFPFPGPEPWHPDSWAARKALEHIETLDADTPHFTWVSFSGPHYPLDVPDEYLARVEMDRDRPANRKDGEWDDPSKSCRLSYHGPGGTEGSGCAEDGAQKHLDAAYWREWRHRYYANVVQIDDYVGRILEAAEKKWGDNLLVIFAVDHGDMMGHHGLWGKNGAFYDDIIRVPLFVRLPGQSKGSVYPEPVSLVDILPTCLAVAGLPGVECDGVDLRDAASRQARPYVLAEHEGLVSVIQGKRKLSRHRHWGSQRVFREQYDLERDPFEFENIYEKPEASEDRAELEAIIEHLAKTERLESVLFFDPKSGETPPWMID